VCTTAETSIAVLINLIRKAGTDIYPEIPNMHRSTRYDPIRPTVTNKDMRYGEGTPCGAECFRNITEEYEVHLSVNLYIPTFLIVPGLGTSVLGRPR
jgi:hypothetical protein